MEKRFIIAIVLVFAVLFLWPLIFGTRRPARVTPPEEKQETAQPAEIQKEEPEPSVISPISEETIKIVDMPLYQARLTTQSARVISWKLKEYFSRTEQEEYMDLIPATARKCAVIAFHDPEIQDEVEDATWSFDSESAVIESSDDTPRNVEFRYTTSKGIEISKRMEFLPDTYIMDVDIGFRNTSLTKVDLKGYDLLWGPGLTEDELISANELANEGPMVLLKTEKGQKLMKHWNRTGFACFGGKQTRIPNGEEYEGPVSWVGFTGKYFTSVLIPGVAEWWSDPEKSGKRYAVTTRVNDVALAPKDAWQVWGSSTNIALSRRNFSIPTGEAVSHKFRIYVGPKKWDILRNVKVLDDSEKSIGLSKMINFGMFSPLGKATLWLLKQFYHIGNNYGIAIILLSVLIKVAYLPLTQKSFNSMNKMQELQPKIAALKEKFRDDPQRINKETMKLYKQHGASPLGGCLPLLLQIPVFWALFSTLRGAVEMRSAVFIPGWVNDLSLPDTVAYISGFPIRILPLIMTGSMLAQQFIFGTGSTGQGSKLTAFMPVFFMFIFYGMPSGLVLYWLCNDVFTFGHRYLIRRQQKAKTEDEEEKNGNKTKGKSKQNRDTGKRE